MREELGGNIVLEGFELDNQEKIVVKKIVGNYAQKIRNLSDFKELKVTGKKASIKAKKKHFEINAFLEFEKGIVTSKTEGINLFVILDETLKKILNEVKNKTNKE